MLHCSKESQRDPSKVRTRNSLVVSSWGLIQHPLLTRDTHLLVSELEGTILYGFFLTLLPDHPLSSCPYCHTLHLLLGSLIYRHAFSHDALGATCFAGHSSTTNSTISVQHISTQVTSRSSLQPSRAKRVSRTWDLPRLRWGQSWSSCPDPTPPQTNPAPGMKPVQIGDIWLGPVSQIIILLCGL